MMNNRQMCVVAPDGLGGAPAKLTRPTEKGGAEFRVESNFSALLLCSCYLWYHQKLFLFCLVPILSKVYFLRLLFKLYKFSCFQSPVLIQNIFVSGYIPPGCHDVIPRTCEEAFGLICKAASPSSDQCEICYWSCFHV